MKETEPTYRITPKGALTLDITERLENLLVEQRSEVCALLGEAHLHLQRQQYCSAAVSLIDVFHILDIPIGTLG